jgi:hypothetical protein
MMNSTRPQHVGMSPAGKMEGSGIQQTIKSRLSLIAEWNNI